MDHRPAGPMPDRATPPPLPPLFEREPGRSGTAPPSDRIADDHVQTRIEMLIREWRW